MQICASECYILVHGGVSHDWYYGNTDAYGQIGIISKQFNSPARFNLLDIGFMYGVGFDLKVTANPYKVINSYIQQQMEWNEKVGWSMRSFYH